jgi:hypothetical protein
VELLQAARAEIIVRDRTADCVEYAIEKPAEEAHVKAQDTVNSQQPANPRGQKLGTDRIKRCSQPWWTERRCRLGM